MHRRKKTPRNPIGVALLVLILVASSQASASKVAPNLSHNEVATIWIGLSDGEVYGYRLSLLPDGTGSGAFAKKDQDVFVFEITQWTYLRGKIEIRGRFVDESAVRDEILLTGKVVSRYMSLVDKGPDWKLGIELRRESEILDWLADLQTAMKPPEVAESRSSKEE